MSSKLSELDSVDSLQPTDKLYLSRSSTPNNLDKSLTIHTLLDVLYPVGSIYITSTDTSTCPLASLILGSTWTSSECKLLTDTSIAPVVGNGTTLGLTDGADDYGMVSEALAGNIALKAHYGDPVGTARDGDSAFAGAYTIGVTTDPTKSGLQIDLSSITGLEIKIWTRIN